MNKDLMTSHPGIGTVKQNW